MNVNPLNWLFNHQAQPLGIRPIPGLTLFDANYGELAFSPLGEPEIMGNQGHWRYRNDSRALAFDGDIASMSPAAAGGCRHWVNVYKRYRHLTEVEARTAPPPVAESRQTKAFLPGKEWLDERGKPIESHLGGIFCEDGVYYWYGMNFEGF